MKPTDVLIESALELLAKARRQALLRQSAKRRELLEARKAAAKVRAPRRA